MTTGLYLLLLLVIPIAAATYMWYSRREVSLLELLGSFAISVVLIWGVLYVSASVSTSDTETWSGRATGARYDPAWTEQYWETYTETTYTGTGSNRKAHTKTKRRLVTKHHADEWTLNTTLGSRHIGSDTWDTLKSENSVVSRRVWRTNMVSGDPHTYSITWNDDMVRPRYPVTATRAWSNRLKNSRSVLNLEPVTKEEATKLGLYEYPTNAALFASDRVLGDTKVTTLNWDRMNSYLGPMKGINLILINFGPGSTMDKAVKQRAYWRNGRKNDIVICIGGAPGAKPEWSYVFGWSNKELVKVNVQDMFLQNAATDAIIPLLESEIERNFTRFDWHTLDYIATPVPWWGLLLAFVLNAGVQVGYFKFALSNAHSKSNAMCTGPW